MTDKVPAHLSQSTYSRIPWEGKVYKFVVTKASTPRLFGKQAIPCRQEQRQRRTYNV